MNCYRSIQFSIWEFFQLETLLWRILRLLFSSFWPGSDVVVKLEEDLNGLPPKVTNKDHFFRISYVFQWLTSFGRNFIPTDFVCYATFKASALRVWFWRKSDAVEWLYHLLCQVVRKFPHIAGYRALRLPADFEVKKLLKSQLALSATDGEPLTSTFVYQGGCLFCLFFYCSIGLCHLETNGSALSTIEKGVCTLIVSKKLDLRGREIWDFQSIFVMKM